MIQNLCTIVMKNIEFKLRRSMASTSFHLSSVEAQADLKTMTTSVDRLFGVDSVTAGSTGQSRPQGKQQLQPQPPNVRYAYHSLWDLKNNLHQFSAKF